MILFCAGKLLVSDTLWLLASTANAPAQNSINTQATCLYPTGQKYSLELIFAKFATTKIANDLNPLKVFPNRCYLPENNTGKFYGTY